MAARHRAAREGLGLLVACVVLAALALWPLWSP